MIEDGDIQNTGNDLGNGSLDSNAAPAEKYLPQSEVDKMIGGARHAAYQKAQKEFERQMSERNAAHSPSVSGLTEEQARHLIAEETDKRLQTLITQHQSMKDTTEFANDFHKQMSAAYERVPGLKEKAAPYADDWARYHDVIGLLRGVENMGDVMGHLVEHPMKMSHFMLQNSRNPAAAQHEMLSLSNSIKTNQAAANNAAYVPDPLSQIKPSNASSDSGNMTVSDYRKMF